MMYQDGNICSIFTPSASTFDCILYGKPSKHAGTLHPPKAYKVVTFSLVYDDCNAACTSTAQHVTAMYLSLALSLTSGLQNNMYMYMYYVLVKGTDTVLVE